MSHLTVFYDSEFTGLTQNTTLISIALTTLEGKSFYAEFTDFDLTQVDSFVDESVLANTRWLSNWNNTSPKALLPDVEVVNGVTSCVGPTDYICQQLKQWIEPLGEIQIWADHVSYDWVLFCELFGGALSLPQSIYYIPMDLCTWLSCHGYDPDCNREEFADGYLTDLSAGNGKQHNALFDAKVSLACYQRVLAEAK